MPRRCGCSCRGFIPGPWWVKNIIAMEAAERFCFYGLRASLILFFTESLGMSESSGLALYSYWNATAYLSPLLGGYIADALWGRYLTILRFQAIYLLGAALLAVSAYFGPTWAPASYAGLIGIALGTGGIKPSVAPFGADQLGDPADITPTERTKYFFVFYQSINFGSTFSYILVPLVRQAGGFGPAFTLPVAMLVLSYAVFLLPRRAYARRAPEGSVLASAVRVLRATTCCTCCSCCSCCSGRRGRLGGGGSDRDKERERETLPLIAAALPSPPQSPRPIAGTGLGASSSSSDSKNGDGRISPSSHTNSSNTMDADAAMSSGSSGSGSGLTGTCLDSARGAAGVQDADITAVATVGRLLPVLGMVSFFWMIYDQASATFTLQAKRMDRCLSAAVCLQPEQLGMINPVLVVVMIPLFDKLLLPALYASKWRVLHPTPLRRMAVGCFMIALSFALSGVVEGAINAAAAGSLPFWLLLPQYLVYTTSELLVSTTGLEFAYSEAPSRAKGSILAIFYLTSTVGDSVAGVMYTALGDVLSQQQLIWTFTGMMLFGACAFVAVAWAYVPTRLASVAAAPLLPGAAAATATAAAAAGDGDKDSSGGSTPMLAKHEGEELDDEDEGGQAGHRRALRGKVTGAV